jgi:exosome complex RNA-binding protein Rrp42 (RNase PH superfamily)
VDFLDITGGVVEFAIRRDSKVVWLSVNGVTACRVCRIEELTITDPRVEEEVVPEDDYELWVSEHRTVMVRKWSNGTTEVATRANAWETWGQPIKLEKEV